ncbi:hypothetical protein C0993_004793, partial [Termitomyces sp. T159_Od127]
MNMSQMGYKLRKHIGKALKARSQAVRNALDKYNAAAHALSPPRPKLSWDLVVEYAFLADFDILSDTRQDVCECPWAALAAQIMMDEYFKIQRAREEIDHLNPGFTGCLDPGVHIQTREDDMEVDEGNKHQVEVAEGSSNGGMSGSKGDKDDTDGDEDDTDGDEDDTDEDEDALLAEQVHK